MIDTYFDYFGLVPGVLMVVGAGILIFFLVAVIAERRTRILFPNRPKTANEDDSFDFFDMDEDDN